MARPGEGHRGSACARRSSGGGAERASDGIAMLRASAAWMPKGLLRLGI